MKRHIGSFSSHKATAPEVGMSKHLKMYLNTFKCPICSCQLDGMGEESITLYCVTDKNHYRVVVAISPQLGPQPTIMSETIKFIHERRMYTITQTEATLIDVIPVGPDGWLDPNSSFKVSSSRFPHKVFNFKAINFEKLMARLKIILAFQ